VGKSFVAPTDGNPKQGKGAVSPQCHKSGREEEDTIGHFAWECEAGWIRQIRDRARIAVKVLVESCEGIRKKYGEYLRWI
tara:strand:+ start:433 stop:672 length:240 start_codon:yes stop_codon:yes gene_type:complete